MTFKFGDGGYVKAPCSRIIILNAITDSNSKILNLKILGKKFQLTPNIMKTTKAYINDNDVRVFLDILVDNWAKPRQQMIALIDLANEKKMRQLKEQAPLRRVEEEKARLGGMEEEELKSPIG